MANNSMNVGFLKGTQANLNALLAGIQSKEKTAQAGAFYITEDTDRLYFAQSDTNLVNLNKSITTVADTTALFAETNPLPGEFYYVKDGNILCYYSATADTNEPNVGTNGNWIQVNVDTDTDIKISKIEVSDAKLSSDKKSLEMTCTVTRTDKTGTKVAAGTNESLESTFKITGEQINSFVEKVTVDVSIESAAGSTAIALGGQGTGSVELKAGTNITLDGTNENEIVINSSYVDTTYVLNNDNDGDLETTPDDAVTAVKLWNSNKTLAGAVNFAVGDSNDDLKIEAEAGTITYKHKDYDTASTSNNSSAINDRKFKAITDLTISNGHVDDIVTSEFELPADVFASAVEADGAGKIIITLNNGTEVKSGQDLYYTIKDENGADVKYYNQASLTEAIKTLIKENFTDITNAMNFKGAIDDGVLPATASVGDVYIIKTVAIAAKDNASLEEDANIGDIIIANGTEVDGFITSGLQWIVVQGTEKDTEYRLITDTADNSICLVDKDTNTKVSTITMDDDDVVKLEVEAKVETVDEKSVTTYKLKATHAEIEDSSDATGTETLDDGESFAVVTGVDYDSYGHVSGFATTTFTLPTFPEIPDETHKLEYESTHGTVLKTNADSVVGRITIKGDEDVDTSTEIECPISVDATSNNMGTDYVIKHKAVAVTYDTPEDEDDGTTLDPESTIDVITGIEDDGFGHITKVTTERYVMPGNNTLDCELVNYDIPEGETAIKDGVSLTHKLVSAADTEISTITDNYVSLNENIEISIVTAEGDEDDTHNIAFNLVWGTF